ncbi:MAG: dTDP-4-dehydrorhamnose 3,5-epimerase [Bacteroidetes bacterium]|nr:dTDP-4-dehydrorhamnose 3,5-epimerase [Bacteroidota bacterium]
MKIIEAGIPGCFIIKDQIFEDTRGYFFESFNKKDFEKLTGLVIDFVQDNQSHSVRNVLRGLHFQRGIHAQAKLVRVLQGTVLDIAVDLRKDSAFFGKYLAVELSAENAQQLFIPRGFAHGFVVLSDHADFFYKCDNYYHKESECGLKYNDPDIAIDWKINEHHLIINDKDRNNFSLNELLQNNLI